MILYSLCPQKMCPMRPPAAKEDSTSQYESMTEIDGNNLLGIYRLGHSDTFACQNCKIKGDKWFMKEHECNGKKR